MKLVARHADIAANNVMINNGKRFPGYEGAPV
jgi:hypothetical protein